MPFSVSLRARFVPFACLLLAALLLPASSARAQSLKVNDPSHLQPGVNRGTLDSFVGDHYWDFYVNPGKFQLVFAGGSPQEGFSVGRAPEIAIAFVPKTPGASFTQRTIPGGGTVFTGTVTQRTRVGIVVEPAKSPLVRQTTEYTLVATGNMDFGAGSPRGSAASGASAAGPSVVGVYAVASGWIHAGGVAKFTADGTIVTTNGLHGTWSLFDADSRIYVVTIGSDSRTLIFQPGRGFIDSGNKNLALEAR